MRLSLSRWVGLCWFVLGCSLCGCARSAVPRLEAESLTAPELRGLAPRAVDLRVSDRRPVGEEDQRATERHVTEVLARVLATRGVTLDEEASARWFVVVQQPVSKTAAISAEACVEVQSELAVEGVSSPANRITRCSQWRQGGAAFGSGVLAFEGAVDGVLRGLDQQLGVVLERFAPPTFDPAGIDAPSLAWLESRELGLTVRDELSADGASGQSLERALVDVFGRAGVRRVPHADYRLHWVLRRPAEGRRVPASACVELSVEAHDGRGSSRLTSMTCSGWSDRLVTDLLRELSAYGEDESRRRPRKKKPAPTASRSLSTERAARAFESAAAQQLVSAAVRGVHTLTSAPEVDKSDEQLRHRAMSLSSFPGGGRGAWRSALA